MAIKVGTGKWYDWPLGGIFDGEEAQTDPYGQLNPEQKAVTQQLGPLIQSQLGSAQPYTGDFTAPMSEAETSAMDQQSRLNAMTGDWAKYYQPGQINPEVDANELRNLNQQFYGDGQNPGAKALAEEQYAGSSGYWGSARPAGVMSTYTNTVTNPYQNWRSTALQNSYQNALNYAQGASSVGQTTANMTSVPRAIKQYGLDQQYADFIRKNQDNQKYIDQALSFLGLGTGTYTPAQSSTFEQMLPELAKIAASVATKG